MSQAAAEKGFIKLKPNQDAYHIWAEQTLDIVRAKHGKFSNYLRKKKISDQDITIMVAPNKVTHPAEYELWVEEMKTIVAYRKKIDESGPHVIGLIQSLLSEESKSKLRGLPNYDEIIDNNDVVLFWGLIEETHKGSDTVDEDIRRIIAEINFQLVQDQNQTLDSYCEESTLKIHSKAESNRWKN
jgi:hypothetical protein